MTDTRMTPKLTAKQTAGQLTNDQIVVFARLINHMPVNVIADGLQFSIAPTRGKGVTYYAVIVDGKTAKRPILSSDQLYAWVADLGLDQQVDGLPLGQQMFDGDHDKLIKIGGCTWVKLYPTGLPGQSVLSISDRKARQFDRFTLID